MLKKLNAGFRIDTRVKGVFSMTPFGAEISIRDADGNVNSWSVPAGDPRQPIPQSQDGVLVVVEPGRSDIPSGRLGVDVVEVATTAALSRAADSAEYSAWAYRQEFILYLSFEGNKEKLYVSATYNRNGCVVLVSDAIAIARRPETRFRNNGKKITRAQWAWVTRRAKKHFAESPWGGWHDYFVGI